MNISTTLKSPKVFSLQFLNTKFIRKMEIKNFIFYFFLFFFSIIIFFPILYAVSTSFMDTKDIMLGKIIPSKITFENYRQLLTTSSIEIIFFNSLVTSFVGMILQILLCSLSAYAIVFIEFKSKKSIFLLIMISIFIPWESIFIPNYFTILKLNLLNTKIGILLPFIANGLGIFLMVQQFKTLNKSLIEAAKIDGCSHIFIYSKIVLPLSKGVISTWAIYSFLNIWNMYLWPLMVSTRPESRTIQIGLKMLKAEEGINFGLLMSGVVIVIFPSLIVLFIGQKQLQKGMLSGAVKE